MLRLLTSILMICYDGFRCHDLSCARAAGILLGLWLAIPLSAEPLLPDSATTHHQRQHAVASLNDAARLAETDSFLQTLARHQQSLTTVVAKPGEANFYIPLDHLEEDRSIPWPQASARTQRPVSDPLDAPVIFVSFSMPVSRLQELVIEADRVGARVVLRGLVNDDLAATLVRLRDFAQEGQTAGIVLDPTLFSRFAVASVPTFLLPLAPIVPCEVETCALPPHVMASGTASLRYFLERVARIGNEEEKPVARHWLARYGAQQ